MHPTPLPLAVAGRAMPSVQSLAAERLRQQVDTLQISTGCALAGQDQSRAAPLVSSTLPFEDHRPDYLLKPPPAPHGLANAYGAWVVTQVGADVDPQFGGTQ